LASPKRPSFVPGKAGIERNRRLDSRFRGNDDHLKVHTRMPTSFILDIQRIVPGGRGIGFHQGQAVFAPLAVPGDHLEVSRWADRKGYLEVLESRLVHPSVERVSPPCPYFGSCGGCDFQQMSRSQQLVAKQDMLIDALRRLGKIQVEASQIRMHGGDSSGYRNRLQLKLVQSGEGFSWGFYKAGSHEVCTVETCLIASNALWARLEILRDELAKLPQIAARLDEVEVFWGDDQECLVALSLRDVPHDFNEILSRMQFAKESLASQGFSVSLVDSKGQSHLLCDQGFVWKTVGGFRYRVSHRSFFQINDPILSELQSTATQGLTGQSALELFCGVGFFTVPLSRNFGQIEVLEGNPFAVNDLEENLRQNGVENCRSSGSDLSAALRAGRWRSGQFDLLFIDPPRSGLPKATVEAIARLGCPNFAYVSCDPATLARDLRILLSSGYEIVSLDLLDLFPQTHHLETIARLRKP
jgi:23S rRNA (uracil1939-C5)-methyltransferase